MDDGIWMKKMMDRCELQEGNAKKASGKPDGDGTLATDTTNAS